MERSKKNSSEEISPRFDAGELLVERYEILRLLGRGGMGEVYFAHDARINRNVALKILHPNLISKKESLQRFAFEAQAVSALNHPHIMTIYEFDQTADGTLFLAAEYVDGRTLDHLIGKELELNKTLDIAIQVSSALSAAHEAGITHRDIKPENIMVRRDGYIKVLDFGLAKLAQPRRPSASAGSEDPTRALHQTKPGAVMGTAAYMSPEQARGRAVDARTDIWSLGVMLYEMVTGQRPFSGETHADVIVSVLSTEPTPLSSSVPDLPPELEWIITKALSKNVETRYQTVKGLRADLERVKKRIEFDENLRRSVGSHSREDLSTAEPAIPTAGDPVKPTSGGREDASVAPLPFWSSLTFSNVVRQIQNHKVFSSLFTLALIALIGAGAYFAFLSPIGSEIDSIAVLPFENRSGNPDLAYAADGISESLIDRLAQLPQLKVISRNSSFKFRGTDLDLRDVAKQLGVRAIVTGSVQQLGDELDMRVNIIDAAENRHLSGGQYRRKANDILAVQKEIAEMVTQPLRLKLTDSQSTRIKASQTENSEAYRYYLNGLVVLNGPLDVRGRALDHFEKAVKLDPDFAAAYAEIAWVHWANANADDDPGELMPKAKAAVEKALSLDDQLAKAHAVRAMVHEYEFDWANAEREYLRAIELSPNLDFARNNYAFFLSVLDRQRESLAQLEEQHARDPLNKRLFYLQKGIVLIQARRFDEALQAYQQAQAVDPAHPIPPFTLGYAYAGKGLYNEAVTYYRTAVEQLGGHGKYSQPLVYLAATYARIPEKRDEARAILMRIENMDGYVSPALLAAVYTALNDNDRAIQLLERAYIKRDLLLRYIATAYEYDTLRSDARFKDLLRRTGLANR